jgi:hypothetical protein
VGRVVAVVQVDDLLLELLFPLVHNGCVSKLLPRAAVLASALLLGACAIDEDSTDPTSCTVAVTTGTSGAEMGVGAAATTFGGDEIAQSFTVPADTTVSSVQLKLIRVGAPTGVLTLKLQESSGNLPNGSDLATGTFTVTYDSSTNTSNVDSLTGAYYTFTLSSTVSLVTTKTYWWRLHAGYSLSDTDVIKWMGNNSNVYSRGKAIYETSTANSFSTAAIGDNRDLLFGFGCTGSL